MRVFLSCVVAALPLGSASIAAALEAPPTTEAAQPPLTTQPATSPSATESTPAPAPSATPAQSTATGMKDPAKPAAPADHTTDGRLTVDAPKAVSVTAGDQDAALKLREFRAAGYKPEPHGSEIWFCRKETIIGSRFEKKTCYTADQLDWLRANAREQVDKINSRISGDPRTPPNER